MLYLLTVVILCCKFSVLHGVAVSEFPCYLLCYVVNSVYRPYSVTRRSSKSNSLLFVMLCCKFSESDPNPKNVTISIALTLNPNLRP